MPDYAVVDVLKKFGKSYEIVVFLQPTAPLRRQDDIDNALKFIKEDGFIILHDVNPPTEWHARESYRFSNSPAGGSWNGTTWKSFLNKRFDKNLKSCCIDTDWGIGIISKNHNIGDSIERQNYFFEYKELDRNRKKYLNLMSFHEFFGLIEA